ncbi:MAG: NAD-dependent epimerase/dehydratase family protein, partial [Planctomycetota bacterium]
MRVFITGGTGLVGRKLAQAAIEAGHEVLVLSRSPQRAKSVLPAAAVVIEGTPAQAGPWQESAAACDAVVNLAGEN